jgi:CDP-glucose 4,6-dehydratase
LSAFQDIQPDFLIHLAAQSLVREGYRRPLETYDTNVGGTLNVLFSAGQVSGLRAQLIVTTDKVYQSDTLGLRGHIESDPLGGSDPYSASKAMADMLSQQWMGGESSPKGAIARAGNVIGVGDVSKDRLIPDMKRSLASAEQLLIRYPNAIRPWQHVLDCIDGYLMLLDAVETRGVSGQWNFGPPKQDGQMSVTDVIQEVRALGHDVNVAVDETSRIFSETDFLGLDVSKSEDLLGFRNILPFSDSISWAVADFENGASVDLGVIAREQIKNFESMKDSAAGSQR